MKLPLKKIVLIGLMAYAVLLAFSYFLGPAVLIRPTRELYDPGQLPPEIRERGEEIEIPAGREFLLRGTLVPGRVGRPLVILIPDHAHSRLAVMERALTVMREHFPVLALDPRGQGTSDGRYCTFGVREADDVRAAIDFLAKRGVAGGEGVILYGVDGGATVAAMEAAFDSRVVAIILESPFANLREALMYRACLSGILPSFLAALPVDMLLKGTAEMVQGFDPSTIDVEGLVGSVTIPVLLIHGEQGESVPAEHFERIFRQMKNPMSSRLRLSGPAGRPDRRLASEIFQSGLTTFLRGLLPPNQ